MMRETYNKDGIVSYNAAIRSDVVTELGRRLDGVFGGNYVSGSPPKYRTCSPELAQSRMCRVSFPHMADPEIWNLIRESPFAELAAQTTGARVQQAWFIHALRKVPVPMDHSAESPHDVQYVGWHQDGQYTRQYFEGDFTTAWISITDVTESSGPVHYVSGSHLSRTLAQDEGSGFSHTGGFERLRERMKASAEVPWVERTHTAPAGTISFHHSRLIHGSGICRGEKPRVTIVLHLRSEKNPLRVPPHVQPRKEYSFSFRNLTECPLVYGRSEELPG